MSAPLRMFIPIKKVDAEQRLVYGIATGETEDRSGEICDYASTKPLYEKWSGEIAKATDGKSLGNVRVMHGPTAAGKVSQIVFNDSAKQIEIAAKIVDDNEWKKVQEGVYTGFSQGGEYVKRWKDDATGLQRYTANPCEVSLVDLPCLPSATFQMVKAAGATEERHFKPVVDVNPSNDAILTKAAELAKAAGQESDAGSFIEPAREALVKGALPAPEPLKPVEGVKVTIEPTQSTPPAPGEGIEQVWKVKDGKTFAKKADAVAHLAAIDADPKARGALAQLAAISDALGIEKSGGDKAEPATLPPIKKQARGEATADTLAKDLYSASRFAQMLADLRGFQASAEYQAFFDGDGDDEFAGMLKAWVSQGCAILIAMVQDAADDMGSPDEPMTLAAGAGLASNQVEALDKVAKDAPALAKLLPVLQKAGARNSKADADKIQSMHDHAVDLGATCKGNADKAHGSADLTKALAALESANADRAAEKSRGDGLQATLDQMVPMIKTIGDRVANIEKQPLPLPFVGGTRVVDKGAAPEVDLSAIEGQLAKLRETDPREYAILMTKAAQQNPLHMIPSR